MRNGILLAGALLASGPIMAMDWTPDGVSASYGQYLKVKSSRDASYNYYRVGLLWDWQSPLYQSENLTVDGYFELAGSSLQSRLNASDDPSPDGKDRATIISFSPVLRVSPSQPLFSNAYPFIDAGIGGAWFSEKDLEKEKKSPINLGSHWLFELRLMAGLAFGKQKQYEVRYGWLHYSNAGLASQNESIDFHAITFGWKW